MLCISHLLKILYSSNLSLCESNALCCSCDTTYLSTFPHDIYTLEEKQPSQFWSFLGEYFTYSRVGETAWWELSQAIKIPCEIWMALSVISHISARCYINEWPREEIAWILISAQRVKWFCQAKRNDFYVGQIYWCSVEWNSHDLIGMQHGL